MWIDCADYKNDLIIDWIYDVACKSTRKDPIGWAFDLVVDEKL